MIARVLQIGGGTYRVRAGGRELEASLRGKLKLVEGGSVAVGDRVTLEETDGDYRITEVLPRTSALTRRAVSRRKDQVMAANIDLVAAVVAAARPEPDLYMLDRVMAVAELEEIEACVVCNKLDLCDDVPEELATYRDIGYDVLTASANPDHGEPHGLVELRSYLDDRTTVLTGASGVGKSSLLNALSPGLGLRVGDVGDRSGRGKHTTTRSKLIPLDDDTFIADTPGIQHFVPASLEVASLGFGFREFRPLIGECRFGDCKHSQEPGCAVLAAVANGDILERRHQSYLRLLEEAETFEDDARTGGGGG